MGTFDIFKRLLVLEWMHICTWVECPYQHRRHLGLSWSIHGLGRRQSRGPEWTRWGNFQSTFHQDKIFVVFQKVLLTDRAFSSPTFFMSRWSLILLFCACPRWLKNWCSSEKDLTIDLFNDARNLGSSLSPNQTFVIIIIDWEMKKTDKMFVWSVSTCAKHPTDLVLQQKALHWRRKHMLKKTSLLTENSPSSQGLKGKHPVFKTDECFQSLRGGGDVSIL